MMEDLIFNFNDNDMAEIVCVVLYGPWNKVDKNHHISFNIRGRSWN